MKLIKPDTSYEQSYLRALSETKQEDPSNQHMLAKHSSPSEIRNNFKGYVQKLLSFERGENLPQGYVPDTVLWLVTSDEFIGQISIRHTLSDFLRKQGGHIGYFIRPSKRGNGYGSTSLGLAISWATKLGIEKILVTCNENNIASKKIIIKNGGEFENSVEIAENSPKKLRFWINTNRAL